MDKNTISHYGWIIVTTMLMVVMIAFATPFGNYTQRHINNFIDDLLDTESMESEEELETTYGLYTTVRGYMYAGCNVPSDVIPTNGDTFVLGDYKYIYRDEYNGWTVKVLDRTKDEYGEILESINDQPVTSLYETFYRCGNMRQAPTLPDTITSMEKTFMGCTSLETPPVIPSTVTNLDSTFVNCPKLITTPVIPEGVTDMQQTFSGCTALSVSQTIPNTVTNMNYTFQGCNNLVIAPYIPESILTMEGTFYGCSNLIGTITIDASPTEYKICFAGTGITDIEGLCSNISDLLNTVQPIG